MATRMQFALRVLLYGPPTPAPRAELQEPMPESGESTRQETAMSLMDEDTAGFLCIRLRRNPGEEPHEGTIVVSSVLHPTMWPAVHETLSRILYAGSPLGPH